jgi:type II secretory pathway pseudopilin PulG
MTSATGSPSARRQAGHTLLEVLLTLALMVLVMGAAAATFIPSARASPEDALDSLRQSVSRIRSQAIGTGRTQVFRWVSDPSGQSATGDRFVTPKYTRLAPAADPRARLDSMEIKFFPDGSCEPFAVIHEQPGSPASVFLVDPWTTQILPSAAPPGLSP